MGGFVQTSEQRRKTCSQWRVGHYSPILVENKGEIIIMNKKDIVKAIANKLDGYTQKDVSEVLDSFLEVVQEQLVSGNAVKLSGFGTFETNVRAARMGRNPKTGEEAKIPERKFPKFKPSKAFKDAVNG